MKRLSLLSQIGFITINLLFWLVVIFIGYFYIWERPPFSTEGGSNRWESGCHKRSEIADKYKNEEGSSGSIDG